MDRANLLLFVDEPRTGKRLLSLHEVQELMTASGMPVAVYLVYCKLMRAGYIVQRQVARALSCHNPLTYNANLS